MLALARPLGAESRHVFTADVVPRIGVTASEWLQTRRKNKPSGAARRRNRRMRAIQDNHRPQETPPSADCVSEMVGAALQDSVCPVNGRSAVAADACEGLSVVEQSMPVADGVVIVPNGTDGGSRPRKRHKKKRTQSSSERGVIVEDEDGTDGLWQYRSFLDFAVKRKVELVLVQWVGGSTSWHLRNDLETPDNASELAIVAKWHYSGRPCPLHAFKKAERPKPGDRKYTASEDGDCAFYAVKKAFELLGKDWVTDARIDQFTKAVGCENGVTWPELKRFIRELNFSLRKGSQHVNLKKLKDNRRKRGEHGREGLRLLTASAGVYLVRFWQAGVGHFIVVESRERGDPVAHEEGCASVLSEPQWSWVDESLIAGVHKVEVA